MSDLISRQDAIKELESGKDKKAKGEIGGFYNQIIENGIEKLRELPSAQPEIIRCKDCARFDKKRGCNLVEGLNIAKADSFCGYAERRTDDC